MAPMDAVLESSTANRMNISAVSSDSDLSRALRRVQELEAEVLRLREAGAGGPARIKMRLLDVEGRLDRQAMERHTGNVSRAARALGLSRSALYRRLERHKITTN